MGCCAFSKLFEKDDREFEYTGMCDEPNNLPHQKSSVATTVLFEDAYTKDDFSCAL